MTTAEDLYRLASLEAGRSAIGALEGRFAVQKDPPSRVTRFYLDTFDWRLHKACALLVATQGEDRTTLRFTSGGQRGSLTISTASLPGIAADLPAGRLRDSVAPLIEMRRLLSLAVVVADSESFRVLDERRKTVARVHLEDRHVEPAQGERRPLPVLVRVEPVKGYPGEFREVSKFVHEASGSIPDPTTEFVEALELIGRHPGDYSSKLSIRLDAEVPAAEEVRRILTALLETLLANENGVREDLDSEFLHDFRVSVRRTRTALTQIKRVFPGPALEPFKREFSWLGKLTGPTRDLDVYLLKMEAYRATLPAPVSGDLEPLQRFLEAHREVELQKLLEGLASPRFRRLVENWRAFLEQPMATVDEASAATEPVRAVAAREIHRAQKRLLKRGRAIDDSSPPSALHRLRIDAKKLRYLLEFFRSLFDPKEMDDLIEALKLLQDNLGDFNDFGVQQGMLSTFAQQMLEEGFASARALMAMGRLVAKLEEEEAAERARFAKRFAKFDSRKNRQRYRRLLAPGGSR